MRSEIRLPIVMRAPGEKRAVCWIGIDEERGDLHRVERRTSARRPSARCSRSGWPAGAPIGTRAGSARRCPASCRARSSASSVDRTSPSSSVRMSTSGSGGSDASSHSSLVRRPRGAQRDLVGLPRRADARLGLDVEIRLDLQRVREIHRAPRHDDAAALEPDLAAVDFGAALAARACRTCRAAAGRRWPSGARACCRSRGWRAPSA